MTIPIIVEPSPTPPSPIPLIPFSENPLFDDWLRAVDQYRTEKESQDQLTYLFE